MLTYFNSAVIIASCSCTQSCGTPHGTLRRSLMECPWYLLLESLPPLTALPSACFACDVHWWSAAQPAAQPQGEGHKGDRRDANSMLGSLCWLQLHGERCCHAWRTILVHGCCCLPGAAAVLSVCCMVAGTHTAAASSSMLVSACSLCITVIDSP
jgi:hypothetical protein